MEVSRTMLNTFSKILREIANTTLQPRVVNSKVFYFRGVEILLKKPPKVKGSFQESWGYDYIMIVPVCIIVVFCSPFRNICTELKCYFILLYVLRESEVGAFPLTALNKNHKIKQFERILNVYKQI